MIRLCRAMETNGIHGVHPAHGKAWSQIFTL